MDNLWLQAAALWIVFDTIMGCCRAATQHEFNSSFGIPAGTIEGALQMDGSPTGTDSHTSATAYLYDIVTQVICAMAS